MERPVLESPVKGDSARAHPPALPCANCGTPLAGPYCFHCGQHIADYHRSVWRFVVDFLDNTFSWDSRFLRTLGPLFRQPGFLTQEFMAGRRVRYVHPLRLFLFTSAVCLTLLHFGNDGKIKVNTRKHHGASASGKAASGERTAQPKAGETDGTDDDSQATVGHPPEADAQPVPAAPVASAAPTSPASSPGVTPGDPDDIHSLNDVIHQAIAGKLDDAKAERVGKKVEAAFDKKMATTGGMERFSRDFTEGIRHRLSYVGLVMLPIFAMMLRALYWRNDVFYFQHLVFSLHYHTFLLLFWTVYSWLGTLLMVSFLHSAATLLLLAIPIYLFVALKRVYGEGVHRTWIKAFVLGGLHLLAIVSGLATIGALSFFSAM